MIKLRLEFSNKNFYNTQFQMNPNKKVLKDYYQLPSPYFKGTMESIILKLEKRVDILLVRSHLVQSLVESRQLISHRKVLLNGFLVKSGGTLVKEGSIIQLLIPSKSSQILVSVKSLALQLWTLAIPTYLEVNYSISSVIYLKSPQIEEIALPFAIDPSLVLD